MLPEKTWAVERIGVDALGEVQRCPEPRCPPDNTPWYARSEVEKERSKLTDALLVASQRRAA